MSGFLVRERQPVKTGACDAFSSWCLLAMVGSSRRKETLPGGEGGLTCSHLAWAVPCSHAWDPILGHLDSTGKNFSLDSFPMRQRFQAQNTSFLHLLPAISLAWQVVTGREVEGCPRVLLQYLQLRWLPRLPLWVCQPWFQNQILYLQFEVVQFNLPPYTTSYPCLCESDVRWFYWVSHIKGNIGTYVYSFFSVDDNAWTGLLLLST